MGRFVAVLGLLAALATVTAAPSRASSHTRHHPQRHSIVLGINTPNAPDRGEIRSYTKLAHAAPAIVMWYSEFDIPLFSAAQRRDVRAEHATPLISWRPVIDGHTPLQYADIAAGKYDWYLTQQALRARTFKQPIFVRFAYEMNLAGQDYGSSVPGETAPNFVAAWRHVVTVFRNAHASNVKFVWSPNTDCAGHCPFTPYWPGDSYVDWLALDGYNFASTHNAAWVSLRYIFQTSYTTITNLSDKPLMFAETASAPTPGNKARWIRQGFDAAIPTDFPRVRAVVWFNEDKEVDWRVNSSTDSLKAWRAVVGSRLYSGQVSRSTHRSPRNARQIRSAAVAAFLRR